MTGEEKRQQLKEQYKRDLMLRKEFLEKAKELQRSHKLGKAITEITSSLNMEETDVWIEHLNRESAITEAKMEMSMEGIDNTSEQLLKAQAMEAEQQKFSAEMLVRQMKKEMGLIEEEPEPTLPVESTPASEADTTDKPDTPTLPRRRLGDF